MNVARHHRRQVDEQAPGGGSNTPTTSGFLGQFPGTHPVRIPFDRSGMSARGAEEFADTGLDTTLAELRELDQGGYTEADVWEPGSEDPTVVAQLQIGLVNAGLLDPNDDRWSEGHFDDVTRSAYRELLTFSNASGSTWDATLMRLAQNPFPVREKEGRKRAPFLAQVTHPEDIKHGLREFFRRTLGSGSIDDEKIGAMVAAYQGQEVASQRSAYNAAETGGTVTAPMDFQTFADLEAKKADPTAYDSRKVIGAADYLARKLRGEV